MSIPEDLDLHNYFYDLPQEQIAGKPSSQRTQSRILVMDKYTGDLTEDIFQNIARYLEPGSLLVANNSRVLPARVWGRKESSGAVEFLLLTPLPLVRAETCGREKVAQVECLLRASRRPKPGTWIHLGEEVRLRVLENLSRGKARGELYWTGDLGSFFVRRGHMPLPPYIKREDTPEDHERYQTVYADSDKLGSVAAPTAGLHFSEGLREELLQKGLDWTEVCLYVGYGTFSPIRTRDVREYRMHPEYIEVGEEAAAKIRRAKEQGRKIVAVGTTTVRTLESVYKFKQDTVSFKGWTDLFIYPGFKFQVVDQMITNFHLPGSSLLLMVAAFAGRKNILAAYESARDRGFRFYSYGDAMLIK